MHKRYEMTGVEFIKFELAKLHDDLSRQWSDYPCLNWPRSQRSNGYGNVYVNGKIMQYAHRVAYELAFGPIPDGLYICHHCDNRACFRPSHLFVGTSRENMIDCSNKGRLARGEQHAFAKLTEEQVRTIRRERAAGAGQRFLARQFGVHHLLISNIVNRKSWRHVD